MRCFGWHIAILQAALGEKKLRIFRVRREVADDDLVAIGASSWSKNFSGVLRRRQFNLDEIVKNLPNIDFY